jgi:hypothetical protein
MRSIRTRHGKSCTPTWYSWKGMFDRCKHRESYSQIAVCERWRNFILFLEDMGERPEDCTIDRIDGKGNYEPSNCRWADIPTQLANRDCTHWIEYQGKCQPMGHWARELGINKQTISERITRGWSIEKALTIPKNTDLTAFGKSMSAAAWSRETGVKSSTIKARIAAGWSVEDALNRPVRPLRPRLSSSSDA